MSLIKVEKIFTLNFYMSDLSLNQKKWTVLNDDPSLSILERLLHNRGIIEPAEVEAYLNPKFNRLHDPFLMEDMQKAVERIDQAIQKQERIIIFGDYDVDGVTGTAILVLGLEKIGASVSYRLPNRSEDGYGLNKHIVEEIAETGTTLLITVDTGISCFEEIKYAKSLGIDVIITDHHSVPAQIPEADMILHPKLANSSYPFAELTGAGVALKFIQALFKTFLPVSEQEQALKLFIDLASLGTIADLGPLQDENRIIVSQGLKQLQDSNWEGLRHLLEICNIDPEQPIEANHVGFRIAPRINAAGRLDSPYYALKLFLSQGEVSKKLAQKLEKINKERQRLTEEIFNEAALIVKKQLPKEKILIAYHPNWKSGLVGIIAGKISHGYSMPTIIMEERNDHYIGSARGPEHFNLVQALQNSEKYLLNFGGHVQAAGFTLPKENLQHFVHSIQSYARQYIDSKDALPRLEIDTHLKAKDVNDGLIRQLQQLRPFGQKNARPLFLIKSAYLKDLKRVGQDRTHLLGNIRVQNSEFNFIAFKLAESLANISEFDRFDIVCHLGTNTYKGITHTQLQIVDLKSV